jgi:hypothetical protein
MVLKEEAPPAFARAASAGRLDGATTNRKKGMTQERS